MSSQVIKQSVNTNLLPDQATSLVKSFDQIKNFGIDGDYVEMNVYDLNNNFLLQISPFYNYKIPPTSLSEDGQLTKQLDFSPDTDLSNNNLSVGNFITEYNILRPKLINTYNKIFFIKEISSDRTELRIATNNSAYNSVLNDGVLSYINEIQNAGYFKEFYLNIGEGILLPCVNIALDENTSPATVLIKLLNPLPLSISSLTTLSVSEKISNTQRFQVSFTPDPVVITYPSLRGANFDIELDNVRANPTQYFNFNQISDSNSSVNSQLQSLLGLVSSSQFSINVDYTDLSNFVHYSSAINRLNGFMYKLGLIENYTAASSSAASYSTYAAQQDAQSYQDKINNIIQGFDGYEKFLYFESSSYAYPKQTSSKPYINVSTSSVAGTLWYDYNYDIASTYDENNQNYLIYALPAYVNEDPSNNNLFAYISSIGLMFDEVWLYTKAITDLYQSRNSLTNGISKDLVYFALQSMGVNVYPNNDKDNVFQYLYGVNPDGTYLPNTSSYETLVTASLYSMPGQDQEKGIYKRIYHNLPLLLKSKGTTRFIQYLNTIFGIPTTIMGYTEYGGVDKSVATTEYEFDRFNYGLNSSVGYFNIPWTYLSQSYNKTSYNDIVPDAIEFRFKKDITNLAATESLIKLGNGSSEFFTLDLMGTSTGSNNSIYTGSTGDFGYFTFTLSNQSVTTSTIPIYQTGSDGDTSWYNVLIQRRNPNRRLSETGSAQYYDIYIKNNVYGEVGHQVSASLYVTNDVVNRAWSLPTNKFIQFGEYSNFPVDNPFYGWYQELRLWSNTISESKFNIHVLNPESIEGNNTGSSFNDLATRFTLGNNLYTYNHNTTTEIYSTHPDQNTQILTASFSYFPDENNYTYFIETYYANVANSGYANPVTDKVRIVSSSLYGTQLLPNKSIVVTPDIPVTKDIHLIDASLSPQDEIDRDIIASLGATYTIDDYIGDPSGNSLLGLDTLRFNHFKKYKKPFNYKDYIRLIEFFHNSLFRTLKDFLPARTNPATGMVIKPHILERSTQQINDPSATQHNNITSSIDTLFITASNGGNYNQPIYSYTVNTNLGPLNLISDGRDFFTGILPSSSIFIHDDFDVANYNPYAIGFKSDNTSSFSQSLWNIEFNPLLNNVSQNQISDLRKKLTLIGGNAGFVLGSNYVTESVDLQDFTYSYPRHINSRYIGTEVSSLVYNTYTSASYTGSDFSIVNGDNSFGKTAAIDKYVRKIGLFTQIEANPHLPQRNNVRLKYIIDEKGNLTELNQINKNWFEIQNTFITKNTLNVSQFDSKKFSNQTFTNGQKLIFDSGYTYTPVLYGGANDSKLYFNNDIGVAAYGKAINSLAPTSYIEGNSTLTYPVGTGGFITNLFDSVIYDPINMKGGTSNNCPTYSIVESGYYTIDSNVNITMTMPNVGSSSFSLQIYSNSTLLEEQSQVFRFTAATPSYLAYSAYKTTSNSYVNGVAVYSARPLTLGGTYYPANSLFYLYSGFYTNNTSCTLSNLVSLYHPSSQLQLVSDIGCPGIKSLRIPAYDIPDFDIPLIGTSVTKTLNASIPSSYYNNGDKIYAKLSQSYASISNYTASLSEGSFIVSSDARLTGLYTTPRSNWFVINDMLDVAAAGKEIVLSSQASNFYSNDWTFLPYTDSGSSVVSSSLYDKYGDVDYPFQLNKMSIFSAYDRSGSYFESRVIDIYYSMSADEGVDTLRFKLSDAMPRSIIQSLNTLSPTTVTSPSFLFLNRINDETNAILSFRKRPGQTSYGFLIPSNLAPDVLNNIDTITSQVKTKLLNEQGSIITDIGGGGF